MSKQRSTDSPLNTDLEQSFFRAWAKRPYEQEHSSDTPSSVTTPTSPKTVRTKRKLKGPANPREISESSQYSYDRQEVLGPDVIFENLPFSKPPRKLNVERSKDRRSSTFSERAQSLFKISTSRKPSNETVGSDPPRTSRDGYIWKRKISGRWLEIRVGQKSKSEMLASKSEETLPDFLNTNVAPVPIERKGGETENKDFATQNPINTAGRPGLLDTLPKESRFNRTKRRLHLKPDYDQPGMKLSPDEPIENMNRSTTFTMNLLRRASTILRDLAEKKRTTPSASASASSSSHSIGVWTSRHAWLFPVYHSKGHSSSSSIRNLKMGQPPPASPNPEEMYTGSDNKQYIRVELSAPDGPSYLPSEARRITTPPLPSADRPLRSFFFDHNSPPDICSSDHSSCVMKMPQKQRTGGVDFYRGIEANKELKDYHDHFELNVPDHLPSSPLCPKNPKHRSGGNGICVYHGRKQSVPLEGAKLKELVRYPAKTVLDVVSPIV